MRWLASSPGRPLEGGGDVVPREMAVRGAHPAYRPSRSLHDLYEPPSTQIFRGLGGFEPNSRVLEGYSAGAEAGSRSGSGEKR